MKPIYEALISIIFSRSPFYLSAPVKENWRMTLDLSKHILEIYIDELHDQHHHQVHDGAKSLKLIGHMKVELRSDLHKWMLKTSESSTISFHLNQTQPSPDHQSNIPQFD